MIHHSDTNSLRQRLSSTDRPLLGTEWENCWYYLHTLLWGRTQQQNRNFHISLPASRQLNWLTWPPKTPVGSSEHQRCTPEQRWAKYSHLSIWNT